MKILYVAAKYADGDPSRGHSFEHYNFFESFVDMGHDLLYFDFPTLLRVHGRAAMNRRLLDIAVSQQPDVTFTVLLRDELDPAVVQRISLDTGAVTVNWFCDDHWRFETFSKHWAPRFNWIITTAASALPKYRALGYRNVIKSQWACNHARYRPLVAPKLHNVTFVGAPHGDRRYIIDRVRKAGIEVGTWGYGWEQGRISQEDMIMLFNQSRINLNLSNSSPTRGLAGRAVDFATRMLERSSVSPLSREAIAARLAALRHLVVSSKSVGIADQIKGRNFEIPGTGAFLLTGRADNLQEFYLPEKEVACFTGPDELARKIRYYLRHEDEREAVAHAGYERTVTEHTYHHRFAEIFQRIGAPSALDVGSLSRTSGAVEEIC